MAGEKKDISKARKDNELHADNVIFHLERFDINSRSYFFNFVMSELLNGIACAVIYAYYHLLLKVDFSNPTTLISNFLESPDEDNYRYANNDHLIKLFPRDIKCQIQTYGPSGTKELKDIKCRITNQDYIEMFHIIAYFVSGIIVILYLINLCYLIINFMGFYTFSHKADAQTYHKISFRKKLLVLLLHKNIDGDTHNLIMEKLGKQYRQNEGCKMTNESVPNLLCE